MAIIHFLGDLPVATSKDQQSRDKGSQDSMTPLILDQATLITVTNQLNPTPKLGSSQLETFLLIHRPNNRERVRKYHQLDIISMFQQISLNLRGLMHDLGLRI